MSERSAAGRSPEEPARGRSLAAARARRRRRWIAAVVAAVVAHGAAFLSLAVAPVRQQANIEEVRSARWVGEQTGETIDLIDPEPLFLPTRMNASDRIPDPLGSGDPGAVFRLFEPKLTVPAGTSPAGLVQLPEGVRTAGVAIQRFSRPYFSAFGQVTREVEPLRARAASLEIRDTATGELLVRREIGMEEARAAGGDPAQWPFWEPFDLLIAVEADGMLGPPLVPAPGSGSELVDSFFRQSLRPLIRPDLIVRPGYYRVLIGP